MMTMFEQDTIDRLARIETHILNLNCQHNVEKINRLEKIVYVGMGVAIGLTGLNLII